MMKLGVLGAGNMASAILSGIIRNNVIEAKYIYVYDPDTAKTRDLGVKLGINACMTADIAVSNSDIILLAVKPNVCAEALKGLCFDGKALFSIVTGFDVQKLTELSGGNCRILRIMPNTPCMVGEGMTVFDSAHTLNDDEFKIANDIFNAIGKVELVNTSLMDAVVGISGSGPAYAFMFIEALADGGVRAGLSRKMAYTLAAQMLYGSAKMVLESGKCPAQLKDDVCSPGGTTIEAVYALERGGMRAAVMDAVDVCVKRASMLGKE